MIFKNKNSELAKKIEKEYVKLCSKQPCGECKYAFQPYCKTLFILDYFNIESKEV